MKKEKQNINIPWDDFLVAAVCTENAKDLTHSLYRYPASMSPHIARAVILALTKRGDTIIDPFCGGGTTLIESLGLGRKVIGNDISPLAYFISKAKATPLNEKELNILRGWYKSMCNKLANKSKYRLVPHKLINGERVALKTHSVLIYIRNEALKVKNNNVRNFALLIVLNIAQKCFDNRLHKPTPAYLINSFIRLGKYAIDVIDEYSMLLKINFNKYSKSVLQVKQMDSAKITVKTKLTKKATLILTSPPYPGVHILYNKWQLYGRRETYLPYELLNINSKHKESYFTLGSRKNKNDEYFIKLENIFTSLKKLINNDAYVVQVISFNKSCEQLRKFRETMIKAGYKEISPPTSTESYLTRKVPNRKWYNARRKGPDSSSEYIFIHQIKNRRKTQ